ncbi:MAG: hypothetical protein MJZ74_07850 [Muribaculaceae bacterium]|nr:hypothetical protein [Muribaculaceae bacterium]
MKGVDKLLMMVVLSLVFGTALNIAAQGKLHFDVPAKKEAKSKTPAKKKEEKKPESKKEAPAPKKESKPAPAKKPVPAKPKPAPKAASRARRDRSGRDSYGREYVDLGLPGGVLWATCNVGASSPWEYGLYFAWGETVDDAKGESHTFDWAHYKWCNGKYDNQTKYCTSPSYGRVDGKTVLDPADDAATANWGAGWRMPTSEEQDDLRNSSYCTWTWTTRNGVSGYEVKSKSNGNSLFLPAAGYRYDTSLYGEGSYGGYWSCSLYTFYSNYACSLYFISSDIDWNYYGRSYGQSVRAVRVPSE